MTVQVAMLTSRSGTGRTAHRTALSPTQHAVLDRLQEAYPRLETVRENFPYAAPREPWRPRGPVRACLAGARIALGSLLPPVRHRWEPDLLSLLARADRTVLLAGSWGLELLGALRLPPSVLHDVRVIAYGPGTWHRPACPIVTIRGRRDRFSSPTWPEPADHIVDTRHRDLLADPRVQELIVAEVGRILREDGGA